MVKMEQIKERGLLPVDFLKHGHDNPDAVEALYANDPTLARMSVSDPEHICNVLSDEELQMLVSQPEGSEQWFREEASACFGCPPDQFPQELIDCWREMWVQKKMGRNSYRAWLRRQRKLADKVLAEQSSTQQSDDT